MMTSEKIDEVTRNNQELEDRLKEKYKGERITFDLLVDEIKSFDKVVFIASEVLNQMEVSATTVDGTLKGKALFFAQLAGMRPTGQNLLGVIVGTKQESVRKAVELYQTAYSESVGQTRH